MLKRYLKEIIIFILQLLVFYVYPPIALPVIISGMEIVLVIMLLTLVLSFVLGVISDNKIKLLYPVAITIVFIPSVFIFYNESALIHSVWYLVISAIGLYPVSGIKALIKSVKNRK